MSMHLLLTHASFQNFLEILLQTTTSDAQHVKVVSGHLYNYTADLPTPCIVWEA